MYKIIAFKSSGQTGNNTANKTPKIINTLKNIL